MASTTFVDGVTLTDDSWFNDVNDTVYEVLGDGSASPTSAVAAMKNLLKKSSDIASATTTNLNTATGNYVDITGTTTIASFGTVNEGVWFLLQFDSSLTITHNATSMILPGNVDILTAAGDHLLCVSLGGGNWRVPFYVPNVLPPTRPVLVAEQATTSGTEINFTSIPAWVNRITVMLNGVSTNGTNNYLLQIGDSGGIENTGYISAGGTNGGTTAASTSGFALCGVVAAADTFSGAVVLTRLKGNVWAASGNLAEIGTDRVQISAGVKELSGTLDRIRLTTTAGANTFDAGEISIMYE